ncbi:MAG: hypothetical protein PHN45_07030 [Methylococcales bacterium]|nr:hypothetical protein [Methylococcales bacterium]MDD5754491.1 hypothetical protein [Methylococcales bacterium]
MQKIALGLATLLFATSSYAIDHSMHTGGSMGGGGSSTTCEKARFDKFQPEHLATVAPESEFSFTAFNVQKPEQIEVNVKSHPVAITTETKGDLYRVTGKLPAELKNTTARINIKATTKSEKCNGEGGWLVTIGE